MVNNPFLGAQQPNAFRSFPQNVGNGFDDGYWTGSFSSHYKQVVDQGEKGPIYHVTSNSETPQQPRQQAPQQQQQQPLTSSYAQQRSDNVLNIELVDSPSEVIESESQRGQFVESE